MGRVAAARATTTGTSSAKTSPRWEASGKLPLGEHGPAARRLRSARRGGAPVPAVVVGGSHRPPIGAAATARPMAARAAARARPCATALDAAPLSAAACARASTLTTLRPRDASSSCAFAATWCSARRSPCAPCAFFMECNVPAIVSARPPTPSLHSRLVSPPSPPAAPPSLRRTCLTHPRSRPSPPSVTLAPHPRPQVLVAADERDGTMNVRATAGPMQAEGVYDFVKRHLPDGRQGIRARRRQSRWSRASSCRRGPAWARAQPHGRASRPPSSRCARVLATSARAPASGRAGPATLAPRAASLGARRAASDDKRRAGAPASHDPFSGAISIARARA